MLPNLRFNKEILLFSAIEKVTYFINKEKLINVIEYSYINNYAAAYYSTNRIMPNHNNLYLKVNMH